MVSEKVQRQRESLLDKLAVIAQAASDIDTELSAERHSNGTLQRSLKPKSGMYVVHIGARSAKYADGTINGSDGSFTAMYRDE